MLLPFCIERLSTSILRGLGASLHFMQHWQRSSKLKFVGAYLAPIRCFHQQQIFNQIHHICNKRSVDISFERGSPGASSKKLFCCANDTNSEQNIARPPLHNLDLSIWNHEQITQGWCGMPYPQKR